MYVGRSNALAMARLCDPRYERRPGDTHVRGALAPTKAEAIALTSMHDMPLAPRLLFFTPSAYPLGGVATWLDYVTPGLLAKGWAPIVGLVAGRWHDVAAYRLAHPALTDVLAVANPTGSNEGRVQALMRAMHDVRPDVVVSVNIVDTCAAVARLRGAAGADATRAPRLVMALHGIQPDLFDDIARERDVLDGVACSNRLALALAERASVAGARLHYVPYGVPDAVPVMNVADLAQRPASPLRIAYVGRIEQWQKRVFDLPAIADELLHLGIAFELCIAGAGPDEPELRQRLAAHTGTGRVRWLGHVAAGDVAERVYRHADVLINPSLWETGPIVVWEAMAHGVAVVSSRYVGCGLEAALVDGENCRLFAIGDTAGAAAALASLTDAALAARLRTGGHALVQGRYSIAASVAAWDAALRAVVAPSPLPPPALRRIEPAGRLDRLLGVGTGERMRRLLGKSFAHAEPGGEWPHSYGATRADDIAFWEAARALDGGS